nr:efflux RND transporter periplasmic adaptor subunit [uncultured Cohaesibacter sp.]
MKHFLSLIAAALLIISAYIYQFGLPFGLASLFAAPNNSAAKSQSGSAAPNNPARRTGRGTGATYVTLADITFKPYEDTFSSIGTGVAKQSVSLISEVSGQIKKIMFDGTPLVSAGDVLLQLEDTSERINVEIAQANLSKAEDSLERYSLLQSRNSGIVTATSMKEAESAAAVARGNLALAQKELEDRAIKSPISGRLGLAEWEVGDFLSNGANIVDINNTQTILVTFELPERAMNLLKLDKEVFATTPAITGKIFNGKIIAFDSTIDETTRTITVKAEIDNHDGRLWPGMTFEVLLRQTTEPLAAVPAMALAWTRDGTQVWLAENGKVRAVPVIFRYRQDDTIWIEGALKEGAKVVVEGVQKLRPGASIVAENGAETTAAPSGSAE